MRALEGCWESERWRAQHIAFFFWINLPLSRPTLPLFFTSLGGLLMEFWWCLKYWGPTKMYFWSSLVHRPESGVGLNRWAEVPQHAGMGGPAKGREVGRSNRGTVLRRGCPAEGRSTQKTWEKAEVEGHWRPPPLLSLFFHLSKCRETNISHRIGGSRGRPKTEKTQGH